MTFSKTRRRAAEYTPGSDAIPESREPLPRWMLWLGAAIPLAAALGGTARWAKGAADDTYVRRDSLALWRQRDSLNLRNELADMKKDIKTLLRACERKGEC